LQKKDGNWYCGVSANTEKFKSISKSFVPVSYLGPGFKDVPLWDQGDQVITKYLREMGRIEDSDKALRFSWVRGKQNQVQMLIPESMLDSPDLELRAKCFDSRDDLGDDFEDDEVDWDDLDKKDKWNIRGVPGAQVGSFF
jgi:hypothetical protein